MNKKLQMDKHIQIYNSSLLASDKEICDLLMANINKNLQNAENKIWHGHPVWFLNGNPVVGYSKQKCGINLLFWSGQGFNEKGLNPEGKFKAAEVCYTDINEINTEDLKRWLVKAKQIQWDYKNIVKNRGVLERLV
jgi:hypothetical protein